MLARPAALALATLVLCAEAPARSAELSDDCRPVLAAMEKSVQVDHATVSTHGSEVVRGVTAGGINYLQVHGAWRKSPLTVQENIAMSRENLKGAQEYTCRTLPDSVVDGTPVANYATHTVSDETVVDSRISIARSSGLAVSVENRHSGDAAADIVTRYSYGNVKAPM